MSGYYALLGRAPSLAEIAQASGWTKAQRDARELQREQQQMAFEQQTYARDAATREQMAAQRHQAQQDALALKKQQADQQAAEATQLANKQRYFGNLLAANPNDPRIIAAARAQGINVDQPATVSLPGGETIQAGNLDAPPRPAAELAMGLQGQAATVLGEPKAPPPGQQIPYDEAAQRVLAKTNLRRGEPGFPEAYSSELRALEREKLARAKAVGGDKTLPAPAVQDMADAEAAAQAADRLLASFQQNIPSSGITDQVVSRIKTNIPNSPEGSYRNEANLATQIIGPYLEGASLKEPDFARYRAMLPQPGDSAEVAAQKVANLKTAIRARAAERSKKLHTSGYRVPDAPGGTPPAAGPTDYGAEFDQLFPGGQ